MSNTQIKEIEEAMITLLKNDTEVQSWKPKATIKTAAQQDFRSDGTFLTVPPSVLFSYDSADLRTRDPSASVYDKRLTWTIVVWVQNLRGSAEAKSGQVVEGAPGKAIEVGAYEILDKIAEILGGARLNLPSSQGAAPLVELGDNQVLGFQPEGIIYRQEVTVITEHARP